MGFTIRVPNMKTSIQLTTLLVLTVNSQNPEPEDEFYYEVSDERRIEVLNGNRNIHGSWNPKARKSKKRKNDNLTRPPSVNQVPENYERPPPGFRTLSAD